MPTLRKRKLKLKTNRFDLFDHPIKTNKTTGKLCSQLRDQRNMLSRQPCIITNNKITIAIVLAGLLIHSMIRYPQLLTNLIHHLLHSSNVINSSIHSRLSHIASSNLQWNTGFMTKNYKGSWLLRTSIISRIQNKLAKRQEHIPIILSRINTASQILLKTLVNLFELPICLWMMIGRLGMFTPKNRNQSRPEPWSKLGITVWNNSGRHSMPSYNGMKEHL